MIVNDFCLYFSKSEDFRNKSRLLILPENEDRSSVIAYLSNSDYTSKIRISDCIDQNRFLPSPAKVFLELSKRIHEVNQTGRIAFVQGLDALLELWSLPLVEQAFFTLRNLLDNPNIHFLFHIHLFWDSAQDAFKHPRYKEDNITLFLGEENESDIDIHTIRLISKEFQYAHIPGSVLPSLKEFVREYEDNLLSSDIVNILIDFTGRPLAGIKDEWSQIYSHKQFLSVFCSLEDDLSAPAIDWLYDKLQEKPQNCLTFLQKHYFPDGINVRKSLISAPSQIVHASPLDKELMIWTLRMSLIEGSYLYIVLTDPLFLEIHFLEFYVCEALNLLDSDTAGLFAEERKDALLHMGIDMISGELAKFIKQSKACNTDKIAPWMNLQTDLEKHELLRRIMTSPDTFIPRSIINVYPLLQAYMEPYNLGLEELNRYFDDYRMLKIKNTITPDFYDRAKNAQPQLAGIAGRDTMIQKYANSSDTALLIVDGLGIEYFPVLLSLAKKRGLGILSADPVFVKLPTSTEFNSISWPEERRLPEIKSLDNSLHNGPEMHSKKAPEEDFVALLEVFNNQILPSIATAMTRYSQVVLTSDHGATRLAVLAYQNGLAKTIPFIAGHEISDWRFTNVVPGIEKSEDLIENLSGKQWIVRGYDRLPKKGPKLHEMHGGMTYEEYLVPFIVFKQGAVFVPRKQGTSIPEREFIENNDFDL